LIFIFGLARAEQFGFQKRARSIIIKNHGSLTAYTFTSGGCVEGNLLTKKETALPEDRIREEFKENIRKALSARGQRRWNLLEELALEHGYAWEQAYSYRCENSYVMKVS
jgi:hypothetical protein